MLIAVKSIFTNSYFEIVKPSYDGCTNNDSVGDKYRVTCSSFYDKNPEFCGGYDTIDFVAAELCCACKGYEPIYYYPDGCQNDDSVAD